MTDSARELLDVCRDALYALETAHHGRIARRIDALLSENADGCPVAAGRDTWRKIVEQASPLIGSKFVSQAGKEYYFFGVVHGDDDYYYGMWGSETKDLVLLSCVGNLAGHGFTPLPTPPKNGGK